VDTTITLEFISDTKNALKAFEQQLKHIHGVEVSLLEPRDHTAPAIVAIGIDEKAEGAAQNVAQTLYSFLREEEMVQGPKKIFIVTIEGDRVEIEKLSVDEITEIIVMAQEG
jgi:hypothetical protein